MIYKHFNEPMDEDEYSPSFMLSHLIKDHENLKKETSEDIQTILPDNDRNLLPEQSNVA